MKKLFILTLIGLFIGSCSVFAYEKYYIQQPTKKRIIRLQQTCLYGLR